ncbi:MAG: hypothetical protein JWM98_2894 [Thermoleophilia bacterium]|nr:hypothetical protein [Thermoleophilia bacterium]
MARPRSNNRMTDAASLLGRGFDDIGDGFGRIVTVFRDVAGPDLARVATPTSLKRGTLTVRCSSASWAQTVSMMELELVGRLSRRLGRGTVQRIVARAGGPPARVDEPQGVPRPAPLPQLPADQDARLEAMVAGIDDPVLRDRVLAAARAAAQRRAVGPNPAT